MSRREPRRLQPTQPSRLPKLSSSAKQQVFAELQPPTNPRAQASISVASIFNSRSVHAKKKGSGKSKRGDASKTRATLEDTGVKKPRGIVSNAIGLPKQGRSLGGLLSSEHPVALAFGEMTAEYRSHVYTSVTEEIRVRKDAFIDKISAHNIATLPDRATSSPLRLSLPFIVEEHAKLYTPLGDVMTTVSQINEAEEKVTTEIPFRRCIRQWIDGIEKVDNEVQELQNQWERVVNEMWKLGVQILGEECMMEMVGIENPNAGHVEDPLSVLSEGDSMSPAKTKGTSSKKKVAFKEDSMPAFLREPSKMQVIEDLSSIPTAKANNVQELEQLIVQLGNKETNDLKKLDKECEQWRINKMKSIEAAIMAK